MQGHQTLLLAGAAAATRFRVECSLMVSLADPLDAVFYPRSIAVVGASSDISKAGAKWVLGLKAAGYAGAIYPVSTHGGILAGLPIAPSLSAITDDIDSVIASVPYRSVLHLIDECILKRARVIQFFTAGFSETGSSEGAEMEREMLHRARSGGLRIIGPNCIGSFCPEAHVPLGPSAPGKTGIPGSMAFISQSGGIAAKLLEYGLARDIHFSKGVSIGNSLDLDASDFLKYFEQDGKTSAIAMYLEGTRNGRRLFETLRNVAPVKPVLVWKSGRTRAGANAAQSHTGSMAATPSIWSGMLAQAGAMEVRTLEELCDCLLLLQHLGRSHARNVAVIGGLADGGGGISVSGSDACADNGLVLPELQPATRKRLLKLIGEVGSILRNPVDVSPAQFRGLETTYAALRAVADDPSIELVIIQMDMDIMASFLGKREGREIARFLSALPAASGKPVIAVLPFGDAEKDREAATRMLAAAGVPVFPTIGRAARALGIVSGAAPRSA